jgi:hypothetical protein
MERIMDISGAYDKRDPDPKKNYGIHCCDLRMILKGELGAVQFVLYTGWFTKRVQEELAAKGDSTSTMYPMPADIGYHSPKPIYEGQTRMGENKFDFANAGKNGLPTMTTAKEEDIPKCEYLGVPCYYDGSSLNAEKYWNILRNEGSEAVWDALEEYYCDIFGELK